MKKALRYILSTVGLLSVLVFCVSATAPITNGLSSIAPTFPEPVKMLLLGLGFIGFGALMNNRLIR